MLTLYYCAVVSPRVLGPLLPILFYSFLLSSFSLNLLYSIPFYSLHPCSERWLIQPDCTVLDTTFIYSKSNTEILGTLSLCSKQSQKKPKSLTAELVGCTYWSLRRRKENITKVRSCEYFLETTRVVSSFETEDLKSSNARLLCFFAKHCFIFWFIFTTLSVSSITCSVGGRQNVWWWTLRETNQSRHGLIRVLSQHFSVSIEKVRTAVAPLTFELHTSRI